MVLLTLNAVFALGFASAAVMAARRGVPFVQHGWMLLQVHASSPGFRQDVERRRAISEGGRFLVGGLLWLGACAGAGALAVYFGWQAVQLVLA